MGEPRNNDQTENTTGEKIVFGIGGILTTALVGILRSFFRRQEKIAEESAKAQALTLSEQDQQFARYRKLLRDCDEKLKLAEQGEDKWRSEAATWREQCIRLQVSNEERNKH